MHYNIIKRYTFEDSDIVADYMILKSNDIQLRVYNRHTSKKTVVVFPITSVDLVIEGGGYVRGKIQLDTVPKVTIEI